MKARTLIATCVAAAVLGLAGYGLYRLGASQAMQMPDMTTSAMPAAGGGAMVDPSTWGIAEGEEATRRHVREGLRSGAVDPATGREILYYHDPMVPGQKFEAPGKSPFMDMMLVPAYSGGEGADAGTITVSPRIEQNLGMRVATVEEGRLEPVVSAVGTIAWNERDQATVQARATGYVEKLHVRATLDVVRKGDPLVELHVPEWVAAQEDFLALRRMQGPDLDVLVDAARQRMRQAGMSEAQIRRVETSGALQQRTIIHAPIGGVVTELAVREGMTVMAGTTLARISGVDPVWAYAEVPESQAHLLRPGARVRSRTPALPGMDFDGTIQALLPQVDPATRTLRARIELANPDGLLVPGMLVQMALADTRGTTALLVPSESVIHTGRRSLVMLAEDEGRFRPVEVETGLESGGRTEILRGLQAGEKVVVSGQFLIDSEAGLKGVEARSAATPDAGAEPVHRTSALVEAIDGDMLTVTHPEIPALKWPAMTMDFQLAPDLATQGLSVGQEIVMEFRMRDGAEPEIVGLDAQDAAAGGAR